MHQVLLRGCQWVARRIAIRQPTAPTRALPEAFSPKAQLLLEAAFSGLLPGSIVDHHVHIVGIGTDGSGCDVHAPARLGSWNIYQIVRIYAILAASGVSPDELAHADTVYVQRLQQFRIAAGLGEIVALPLDSIYTSNGVPDMDKTDVYTPNNWVQRQSGLTPACSVHPDAPDALAVLTQCAGAGARIVKLHPSVMKIDPSDERYGPFFAKCRELDLTILAHSGKEHTMVPDAAWQRYNNPLLWRQELGRGTRVIMAHCATAGKSADLDNAGELRDNFELWLRLMDEPRYEGVLFGDISSITSWGRVSCLETLLERSDLHSRLVNGSDWPLPGVGFTQSLALLRLMWVGHVPWRAWSALSEIWHANPLLYDVVLKRMLRSKNAGQQFAKAVFQRHPAIKVHG